MQSTSRVIATDIDTVWSVLADGWLYPLFVVGASRMREVDDSWPEPGSRLHHSVGSWPALINDHTTVLAAEPPSRLRLRARAWPSGEAEVEFLLEPEGTGTHVELREDVVAGPATLIPAVARHPLLGWRNTETLRRLAYVAERRGTR
ncbi:SRPBCC family protein [Nocardioides sp.]|uniref:SRPBCC family protein n=1 Tax=Nocardioides sp. TaxID=35761 RepID=UPI002ED4480F